MHSMDFAVTRCPSPTVCLLHTGILWKWLHIYSNIYSPSVSHSILVCTNQTVWQCSDKDPLMGSWNAGGYEKYWRVTDVLRWHSLHLCRASHGKNHNTSTNWLWQWILWCILSVGRCLELSFVLRNETKTVRLRLRPRQ